MSSLRYGFRCLRDLRPTITRHSQSIRAVTNSQSRRTLATNTDGQRDDIDSFSRLMQAVDRSPEADSVQVAYRRPMPVSPSYFSRQTAFNDSFVLVQDLARKYGRLPTAAPNQIQRVAWKTREQYRLSVGEGVKARDFATCIKLVKRLSQIHPDLMPEEVTQGLKPFKRDINVYLNKAKQIPVDRFGRSHGVGRRKSSVARAWLVEGTGDVLINGKAISDAFGRIHDRESALWGLKTMERMDKYNVWALVEGGGTTGQAEALAMAIAKALAVHEPALKAPLRKAGCLTRDPRKVERKKPGHVKARKMPAWVKR
ncbi:37S ribosomal protein S9 [Annulohypoxylon maeteangense]|uniref:37S ribosomal protein S9 n=1 Tax=Annulohypoxylon maeteangense TaxID=1927788 RepID=UPI0020088C19|nr:37S ribosomal protein S9 [Annulohypoxylon maeteangense]KAI0885202.1 37S ribosomal protein S9 [Annulohypoxylon maeteangense]